MANESHLNILRQGVEVWNSWRDRNPSIAPDLSELNVTASAAEAWNFWRKQASTTSNWSGHIPPNLSGSNLAGAYFAEANLADVNLSKANLIKAAFHKSDLSSADLTGADLTETYCYETSLWGTLLAGANLTKGYFDRSDLQAAHMPGAHVTDASLRQVDLSGANLSGADLSGADLSLAKLVDTNLKGATLTGCRIYGISAWNLELEGAKQWNLNVSNEGESAVMVDNLEVAQFIYLLLNHKKLRDVLNAITERGVLILGRFGGGGLEVLQTIAAKLRESKYQPFIFDFDRPADRNYTETLKTLVGLSRFVIVDLSGPSVPQELYATVPHFKIPFVPIIEEGRRQYSMVVDILEYPWVLNPPVRFVDVEHLVRVLPTKIIAPAEILVKDRQDRFADLFNA